MADTDQERRISAAPPRKIIHIDMDAFYASVEQRDNPDLRGKPVAVGGSSERGVVAAASYEARKFGVRSAMPSVTAKRQCPNLIFVKPRFDVYKAISRGIRNIFAEHTPIIEPLSLDEAYLDVTENLQGIPLAREVALRIRERIKAETGLMPRQESHTINSSQSLPRITANRTGSTSSHRRWAQPSLSSFRLANSTVSVLPRERK
jgi:DNA polymerase IV